MVKFFAVIFFVVLFFNFAQDSVFAQEQKSSAQVSYNAAGPVQWENHQVFVIRQAAIGPSSQDAK
ncbi:MAG: hypothetical protein LBC07_00715, partial [Elusimicrobiota bacterium]|nr:hypothetical protein [Elusimicrobiota bacterium]